MTWGGDDKVEAGFPVLRIKPIAVVFNKIWKNRTTGGVYENHCNRRQWLYW